jgi:excisionase family DNA binding protein
MSHATASILDVETAAAAINTTPLNLRRLIARKRIKATKLGNQFKVLEGDLSAYVANGAQDFRHPPIGDGWFLADEDTAAGQFESALSAALMAQIPGNEAAQAVVNKAIAEWNAKPAGRVAPSIVTDYALAITPAVRDILARPVTTGKDPAPKYRDQREQFLSVKLRDVLAARYFMKPNLTQPIERLYGSPEDYKTAVAEAWEALMQRKAFATHQAVYNHHGEPVNVYYTLPMSALLATDSAQRVPDLAL